ncbi:MAG: hypothetical protein O3A51_12010 [Verrucomicrobia bacterium]|nr:hypothetical protein [Verrucomicrobiota bacterium]
MYAIAIGLVLLAVVMINLGVYQLLAETYGNPVGAFLVAAGNGLLAAIILLAVRQLKPGPEEQTVREIRDAALAAFTTDVNEIEADFALLGADVKRVRRGLSALRKGGNIGIGLVGLAPMIGRIIKSVKQRRKDRKADPSSA